MVIKHTDAGTEVVDLSPEEYRSYLDAQVLGATGMTVPAFVEAYEAGQLDEADPAVEEFSVLLRLGQDGHTVAT